jgi:transcriptional regulator with XRE-family HTH domain
MLGGMRLADIIGRIDERLAALGLSMAEAERRIGKRDAIRKIKRAAKGGTDVTLQTLAAVAPALKTTPQWLLTGEGKAEIDEVLEMVPFEHRATLNVPDTIDGVTWAILALCKGGDTTEAEARILARAVVRALRLPPTLDGKPVTAEERRRLIEMSVALFREREV